MATELSANNPDLIESIRRNMNRPGGDNNNDPPSSDNNNNSDGPGGQRFSDD